MTYVFTCNACLIQFRSSDQQRYHMKTEWHRYNLKRKLAQLGPIPADLFAEKVQLSEKEKELNQVDEFGFPILKSKDSQYNQKKSSSVKTKLKKKRGRQFDNVEVSRNHARSVSPAVSVTSEMSKMSLNSTDFDDERSYGNGFTTDSNSEYHSSDYETSEIEAGEDEGTEDEGTEERPSATDCIFCTAEHKDIERNVSHMFRSHGLYIPEPSFLIDLPGLLDDLIDLIVIANRCLCCSFQGTSLESIRAHISSKSHARLPYETKEERAKFSQFYDFSLADNNIHDKEEESDTRVTGDDADADVAAITPDDTDTAHSSLTVDMNSNYALAEVDDTGVELTLPTGVRAGHRSMRRFYRQNLPLPPDASDGNRTLAVGDRRFLGGVTDKTIRKNDKNVHQLERQSINRKIRTETRRSNFQTHFRDELLQ
ncbi:LANO_0H18602g1_1 [Lachancea nothofagi CBS 11611]|uniref:LANO_0H18602g1_1 n=1 Tax=Lachancea nothofagi CBS 11611 TaxID=1266666 RepID=A0A1G4KN49_9SACH|nr:LANO_0H18602g1_1 [Lachancea nothofagi CBS 11611]